MDIRDALDSRPDTEHGLLIAYGQFARQIGLLERLMAVPVPAKTRLHRPQAKLTEFLVGILSGLEYLQDLDLAPRPLTKDLAVARAWGQPGWAHYSGVSRTLEAADDQTVAASERPFALAVNRSSTRPLTRNCVGARPWSSTPI